MIVHTLELADKRQLGRAFEAVLQDAAASDCAIELDSLRIRFTANDEERAARIIRELVQGGGLRAAAREWVDTGMVAANAIVSGAKER